MVRPYIAPLGLAFGLGLVLSAPTGGCVRPDPNHCANQRDPVEYCRERFPEWDDHYCTDSSCLDSDPGHTGCTPTRPAETDCLICDGDACDEVADTGTETDDTDTGSESESATESGTDETDTTDTGGPVCGSGIVEDGEECDDGDDDDLDECSNDCVSAFCGDGVVQESLGEACDDGNALSGDGCSSTCRPSGTLLWDEVFTNKSCVGRRVELSPFDEAAIMLASCSGEDRAIAVDSSGDIDWDVLAVETSNSLAITDVGEFAVGGDTTFGGMLQPPAARLELFAADGTDVWSEWLSGSLTVGAVEDVVVGADGHLVGAGVFGDNTAVLYAHAMDGGVDWGQEVPNRLYSSLATNTSGDLWVLADDGTVDRYTGGGNFVWTSESIAGVAGRIATNDADETYLVLAPNAGVSESFSLTKFDSTGAEVWTEIYDPPGITLGMTGIAALPSGGVIVAGTQNDGGVASGLVIWFGPDGSVVLEDPIPLAPESSIEQIEDVAVSPEFDYGVVVGGSYQGGPARLRVRKFVI